MAIQPINDQILLSGTVWVSPYLINSSDQAISLVSSRRETIAYDQRIYNADGSQGGWNWGQPEEVSTFEYSDGNNESVYISASITLAKGGDLSRLLAKAYFALPKEIRDQSYKIQIDHDEEGAYYDPTSKTVIIGSRHISEYQNGVFLEELLFHEIAHASIDRKIYPEAGWKSAQAGDNGRFLSQHGFNNPNTEDVAETLLPLYAILYSTGLNKKDIEYLELTREWAGSRYKYLAKQVFGVDYDPFGVIGPTKSDQSGSGKPVTREDVLIGTPKKADTFEFRSKPNYNLSADLITNFNAKEKDKVLIASSAFGLSGTGAFKIAKNSKGLTKLLASDTQFIYNKADGGLYFNQNGATAGFGSGGIFAILEGKPTLGTSSVSVVA